VSPFTEVLRVPPSGITIGPSNDSAVEPRRPTATNALAAQLVAAGGSNGGLADELVVVGMRPDPEPHDAPVRTVDGENAIVKSDSARPEAADLLEVERRVTGVGLQDNKLLVGKALNGRRERAVGCPKTMSREVLQISVDLPDL